MKIIIKVLQGQDCTLEVTALTTILQIKKEIEQKLNIPSENQKLLLLGRPVNDENTVGFYPNIKEGTKLNLIVKRADSLRDIVFRSFRKYFSDEQSERLSKTFMIDFERNLQQFSLDDIERFSTNILCL